MLATAGSYKNKKKENIKITEKKMVSPSGYIIANVAAKNNKKIMQESQFARQQFSIWLSWVAHLQQKLIHQNYLVRYFNI